MLGHKERPEQPAATLDRTIQNLRNKGYIEFIARGEYKLTEKGFNTMNTEHENIIEPLIKQLSQKNHNEADRRVQL
jgi:predicted transcriptional regulator